MNSGVNVNDPVVTAAFNAVLLHQGLIAQLIFVVLGLAWLTVRAWLPATAAGAAAEQTPGSSLPVLAEPAWRQLLRIGFGLLWIFDGILQAQPKMAIGLPSQVIEPVAAGSPRWVQHVVNWAGTAWSYHPVQAAASAVWIQVGIGIRMLAAARGTWSRLAGLAGVGWGLVVWVFGESFGGIFAPGLTWLFGAPGAVLLFHELIAAGATTIVRAGTCGALVESISDGDLIVATGAVREDGVTDQMVPPSFQATSTPEVVMALQGAAERLGHAVHRGTVLTRAAFFPGVLESTLPKHAANGVVAVEMELAALLVTAALKGIRAGGVFVSDGNAITNTEAYNPHRDVVREGVSAMLTVGLDALHDLDAKGAA
jgi:uridine phosphorylase